MANAARGTFEELLNGTAPELANIARRLREAIFAVDPAAVETVRLGDNAATYGVGPKKMTEGYAYIMPAPMARASRDRAMAHAGALGRYADRHVDPASPPIAADGVRREP